MLNKDTAFAVIETALSTGGDFAEIFLEDRVNGSVTMRSGKIENQQSCRLHGAGVRVFSGLSAVYVYTNDTGRDGLIACAKRAAAAVAGHERVSAAPFSQRALDNRHIITIPPFSRPI